MLQKLGGKCRKCGFTDPRALQVDHINGDGARERRTMNLHRFSIIVLRDTTNKYQLLCANCNWIKRHEKKEYGGGGRRVFYAQ